MVIENRPTAPDSLVDTELAAAEREVDPERLIALDANYELSAPQCLAVGDALASVAQSCYDRRLELDDEEDGDERDVDDQLEERVTHAVALQIAGGGAWEMEADYSRTMTRDEVLGYLAAVGTLHGWAYAGNTRLLKPVDIMIDWPKAKGRASALRLAEELLPSLRVAAEQEPLVVQAVEQALERARAVDDLADARTIEAIHAWFVDHARRNVDEAEAARAAEKARTDPALNRAAYLSFIAGLGFRATAAALAEPPDFERLFEARVEMGYARYALEENVETYYSKYEAAYDELLNLDRDQQAEVASREIQELLHEAMRLSRRSARRGESG